MSLVKQVYRGLAYPETRPCHVVLEPLVETGSVHTRLAFLLDRISDKFRLAGLEPPATLDLTFAVYADGREVHRHSVQGHPIGRTLVWDSGASVPRQSAPVEGTVAVESVLYDRHGRQVPQEIIERVWGDKFAGIVDFMTDWYEDGRFITTSHANIPVKTPVSRVRRSIARAAQALADMSFLRGFRSSRRVRPGSISVFNDGTFESSLIYYTWLDETRPREIWAELRNADGLARRAPLPPLPPRSFMRVRLSELFPDSREFLRGQVGNFLLDRIVPLLTCNPRFYIQTTHGALGSFGVDHAYLEHLSSPTFTSREAWRRSGKGLHSPCVVVDRDGTRTALVLFNMIDIAQPKTIGVLLYDAGGALIVDKRPAADLPPAGLRMIWVRDLLNEVGYRGDFVGHAEVFYCMDVDLYPDMLHHQVLYIQGSLVEGVQLMVGLWNSPRGWRSSDISDPQALGRVPIYAPAYVDEGYTTYLGLTNCSHAWEYDVEAVVEVSLKGGDAILETREIAIPPHGTWFEPVTHLFPEARSQLRPHGGRGIVVMDPKNVRTLGAQFFHLQHSTGCFSSEHTF